ncbi:acetate kinase [Massilia sp. erpn]|uniref:acetate kinase n=1 Tax=Massilia sp. erpn TaxID=2738142 RepID=UPI002103717F|nr:acetate kinase [Massilia sp. erpn]UTY60009.1 acetate kinase [Massilia sp. erpn]
MQLAHTLRAGSAGLSLLLCSALAQGQQEERSMTDLAAELAAVKQQLAEQRALLKALKTEMEQLQAARPAVSAAELESRRGAGAPYLQAGSAGQAAPAQAPVQGGPVPATAAAPNARREVAQEGGAVGKAPERDSRPPEVAPIFEAPGVLTPKGHYVLEPSVQFGYSSSNRVALVGYTIIPAILIGLVDVREIKRNTFTAALTGRYGINSRTEIEMRVPYVYRSDSTVSREIFTGSSVERVFETSGRAIGDVELALRRQLNDGGADKPFYVAGLRIKSRTGRDPFEVVTDCSQRCVGQSASGTGLPLTLPTGSGFYAVQPSLTWLFPSDPAIFFGSVSYLHNFKRKNVTRRILNGESEELGTVAPGAVIGANFGIGLALNEKASLSLGYDHQSVARTRQNGQAVPGSVRTQLGTLLMGFTYRFNEKRSVNISVGAGLTRDTPDVSLSIRVPMNF